MSSNLWICKKECAKKPFRLGLIGIEIRTIEELCYYLFHNMDSLDEAVVNEELFNWLAAELNLPSLASTLEQEHQKGRTVLWCAWFLLKEIGMYTASELEEIRSFCFAMENKDEFERQKMKADRFLKSGNYRRSIEIYRKLLNISEEKTQNQILLGDIRHNMGVALAKLFLFQEAEEYFQEAYQCNQRQESLEAYEQAKRMQSEQSDEIKTMDIVEPDWDSCLQTLRKEYKKKVI